MFGRRKDSGPGLRHADALARMRERNIEVATIVDVGAAKGDWTQLARTCWPNAAAHLLEAKESWRGDLAALQRRHPKTSFEIVGAWKRPGTIYFPKNADEYGGAVFEEPSAREDLEAIKATSIDYEVERLDLKRPLAIKLDTHGTEVDILDGASSALDMASFLCIEAYNLIGQKRFPHLIADLEERGFRCADIVEPMFRPGDRLLWQMDFYFMRADHPSFQQYGFLP